MQGILKKKATKSNSSADWLLFKEKRNAVNQLAKKTKKSYYQEEIKNNSGNPKGTWNALNSLMGKKTKSSEIPKIKLNSSESTCITDAKGIANSFNTLFTEIGPKLASQIPPPVQGKTFEKYLKKLILHFALQKSYLLMY